MQTKMGLTIGLVVVASLVLTASAAAQTSVIVESATTHSGDTFTIDVALSGSINDDIVGLSYAGVSSKANLSEIKMHADDPGEFTIGLSDAGVGTVATESLIPTVNSGTVTVEEVRQQVTAVSIEPQTKTVGYDETFTLNIKVDPAVAIAGVQCSLAFDPSVVTVNRVTEGNLLKQGGASTYFSGGAIDNFAGTVTGIVGAITTAGAVQNEGAFAVISLTAGSADGTTTIDLSNVVVGDINGDAVDVEASDGSVTVEEQIPISITVTPATATVAVGGTQTFTATAYDQIGNPMSGVAITWSTTPTGVGTVSPTTATTGATGIATTTFTGVSAGTTTVMASSGTVYDTASVTVSAVTPVLTTITVSPSTATVAVGGTQTFTATAYDQKGNLMSGITIRWASTSTSVGIVMPYFATTCADGTAIATFTGVAAGTTTVTAESGTVSGTATVTVKGEELTVLIYTDKTSYTAGDTMRLGLDVANSGDALPVKCKIWLEKPSGGVYSLIDKAVTLSAGLDYSNSNFKEFTLPGLSAGTYLWHAQLSDPITGEIISEDTAEWDFVSTRTPTEEVAEVPAA